MARKLTRKGAIRKLDGLCREIVHVRDRNSCRKCGLFVGETGGNVHHCIPKKRGHHVRWALNNLILFCPKCHFWWHKEPFAIDWFRNDDPDAAEVVSELNQQQTQSFKQADLLEWIDTLEQVKRGMT